MIRRVILTIGGSGLILAAVLIYTHRPKVTNSSPQTQTLMLLQHANVALALALLDIEEDGVRSLEGIPSGDLLREAFLQLMKRYYPGPKNRIVQEMTNLRDGWQRPVFVYWRVDATNVSVALLANSGHLIIWSSGANGINDWGYGDDVYYSPPSKTVRTSNQDTNLSDEPL